MKLYVIRHGQTDYNAQRRFQGQADIPLNENGRDQARRAGTILSSLLAAKKSEGITTQETVQFISSDLLRTKETSMLVLKELSSIKTTHLYDSRLREFHCGMLENNTYEEFVLKYPELSSQYMNSFEADSYHTQYPGHGGESRIDVMKRVGEALKDTSAYICNQQNCVWVAHGGVIDVLLELMHIQIAKPGNDRISAGNGDLMIFNRSEKQKILSEQSEKLGFTECWILEKHYKIGNAVAAKVIR